MPEHDEWMAEPPEAPPTTEVLRDFLVREVEPAEHLLPHVLLARERER